MLKLLSKSLLILLVASPCLAQSRQYNIGNAECDGAKFMARYGFTKGDFWRVGNFLVLRDFVFMPDNPPICEQANTPVVAARNAAKVRLDSMPEMVLRAAAAVLLDQVNLLRAALPHAIVSLTRSGSTVTATTPIAHGLNNGDTVSVFGADQAGYSGQQIVTGATSNTFTYTIGTTPATPATGSLLYVEGPIPGPTPQVTLQQAIQAIKNKIDSGAVD